MSVEFDKSLEADRASTEPAMIVDVEGFEGPLDLLLMLARQQKVDLAKISILALADQYLQFSRRRENCASSSPPIIW
jgi:segregation and condensation protein A